MKKSSSAHPVRSNSAKKKICFHEPRRAIMLAMWASLSKSWHIQIRRAIWKTVRYACIPHVTHCDLDYCYQQNVYSANLTGIQQKKTYKLVGKYPIIHQLNFFELISHEQMIKNAWTWNLAPYSHVLARSYKVLPAQSPSTWLSSYIDSTWESLDATARPQKKTWGVVAK